MARLGQIVCVIFGACCVFTAVLVPLAAQWLYATGPDWVRAGDCRGLVLSTIGITVALLVLGIAAVANALE